MTKIFKLLSGVLCILSVHPASTTETSKCSSSTKNKYYIHRSQTPNFTTLEDYPGQLLSLRWDLKSGTLTLAQEVTDAVEFSWIKYSTTVQLKQYVTKAVDQKWKFGKATITINHSTAGAIYQKWDLDGKWYRYEKTVTGAVTSEGNATTADLAKYEQEIDLWCQANCRFFPPKYCPIYARN